ncbi:MAG TPA: MFS transporter [Gaiellaceae bacterium]|nr:MFS transporter [Gaiellaceae bacterium]
MELGLAKRVALLGTSKAFRQLLIASVASGFGTWLAFVALTVDVWDTTHSSVWVAALLAADFLPTVAVGLFLGPFVDRLSRKRVLVVSDLVRCVVFAVLPFTGSPGAIVVLAAVSGFATGFFRPAVYASVPNLVSEDDLPQANSLMQACENLTWLVTPPLAGLLVAAAGPDPGYVLNSVSFALSALLISRIPARLFQAAKAVSEGHMQDLLAGVRLVLHTRPLLTVFVAWNVFFVSYAAVNVAEITFAKETLDAGDFGFGLLLGAGGLGLVIGSYLAGSAIGRFRIAAVYGGSIGAIALGIAGAAAAPVLLVAAACVVVAGFGNGIAVVCNVLLVQRGAPDELRGRAFTIIMSTNYAVLGVSMAVAGLLTDAVGARWVWALGAAVAALAAVLGYALAPRPEQGTAPVGETVPTA